MHTYITCADLFFEATVLEVAKPHVAEAQFRHGTLFFSVKPRQSAAKVFDAIRSNAGFILPHMALTHQFTDGELAEWSIDF